MIEVFRKRVNAILRGTITAAVLLSLGCSAPREPLNVILIVVDTLRADRLGVYGAEDRATPTLDALAAQGVCFQSCVAQAPWTIPSVGSILTGQYPSTHGADWLAAAVSPDVPTLAERFRDHGHTTAAFISHRLAGKQYGFDRGFADFDQSNAAGEQHVSSKILVDFATSWLDRNRDPFFLFLHFFDPHYSYMEHEGLTRTGDYSGELEPGMEIWGLRDRDLSEPDLDYLRELYAGEIRFLDVELARLIAYLEENGLAENTAIVVTADHGEEFLEHGWLGHTTGLYQGMIHVPLIIHAPDRWEPELRADPAMLIDLHPTLLSLAGLDPAELPGRDLTARDRSPRSVVSEVEFGPRNSKTPQTEREAEDRRLQLVKLTVQRSVQRENWKAIDDHLSGELHLFDLETDPGETTDLAAQEPGILADLEEALADWELEIPEGDSRPVNLSDDDVERLRALGYTR